LVFSLQCTAIDPATGQACRFFCWKVQSASPSVSPTLSQFEAFAPSAMPTATQPMQTLSLQTSCPVGSCCSTRIRVDCGQRFCKTHCLAAGGCASKAHQISAAATLHLPSASATLGLPSATQVYAQGLAVPSTASQSAVAYSSVPSAT
jgi:hypothetical protein